MHIRAFLIVSTAATLLLATTGCEDQTGVGASQQAEKLQEAASQKAEVAQAAVSWIREHQFHRRSLEKIPVEDKTVRTLAQKRGESVKRTRIKLQYKHCVGCPTVDPSAFAVAWYSASFWRPGASKEFKVPQSTSAAVKKAAEMLDKPLGKDASLMDCTGQGRERSCSLQEGLDSVLSFYKLEVEDDGAKAGVKWYYEIGSGGILGKVHYRTMTLNLAKRNGSWKVQGVESYGIP
jgi:hypothetical protein